MSLTACNNQQTNKILCEKCNDTNPYHCVENTCSTTTPEICSECQIGYFLNEESKCVECATNQCDKCYADTGKCETCKPGYGYTLSKDCVKCTKGNYIREEYICCNCGIGSISTEDNAKECQECEQKYGANEDNTKCIKCSYGTYSTSKGSGCIQCKEYQYTLTKGSTYCLDCPKGQTRNETGNGRFS